MLQVVELQLRRDPDVASAVVRGGFGERAEFSTSQAAALGGAVAVGPEDTRGDGGACTS